MPRGGEAFRTDQPFWSLMRVKAEPRRARLIAQKTSPLSRQFTADRGRSYFAAEVVRPARLWQWTRTEPLLRHHGVRRIGGDAEVFQTPFGELLALLYRERGVGDWIAVTQIDVLADAALLLERAREDPLEGRGCRECRGIGLWLVRCTRVEHRDSEAINVFGTIALADSSFVQIEEEASNPLAPFVQNCLDVIDQCTTIDLCA